MFDEDLILPFNLSLAAHHLTRGELLTPHEARGALCAVLCPRSCVQHTSRCTR